MQKPLVFSLLFLLSVFLSSCLGMADHPSMPYDNGMRPVQKDVARLDTLIAANKDLLDGLLEVIDALDALTNHEMTSLEVMDALYRHSIALHGNILPNVNSKALRLEQADTTTLARYNHVLKNTSVLASQVAKAYSDTEAIIINEQKDFTALEKTYSSLIAEVRYNYEDARALYHTT